jgi:hypothetical protein
MITDLTAKMAAYQTSYDDLITAQADALQVDDADMSPCSNWLMVFDLIHNDLYSMILPYTLYSTAISGT